MKRASSNELHEKLETGRGCLKHKWGHSPIHVLIKCLSNILLRHVSPFSLMSYKVF